MEKQTWWQRLKIRRRVAIMDDQSWNQLWSFRLSALGLIIIFVLLFAFSIGILSLAIIYTPMRNILPGYNQNLREQLMDESVRLDSLSNTLALQSQYLNVIRDITAGEVSTDSMPASDSLQLIFQEQLLEAKREVTEEFVEQYEQKEKNNLQLFDIKNTTPVITLSCPAHGVVTQHYNSQQGQLGVTIQTRDKENVVAVLDGTVVAVNYLLDNTYTIVVQHEAYVSIYRQVGESTKSAGTMVKAGETIGLMSQKPLLFELWKDGKAINPEEIIVF